MQIQAPNGRMSFTENTLIITNVFTGQRLCIVQPCDFVLYLGDKANLHELTSSDFTLNERIAENAVVREYTLGNLSVFVTYESKQEIFVKRVKIKSDRPIKLCKICLLGGSSSLKVSRGGEGQPVFFGGAFWGGTEFPAALNYYENNLLCFMQAPYESIQNFECFPVVFGMDTCGDLENTFNRYIENRSLAKRGIKVYGDWCLHDELDEQGPVLDEQLTFSAVDRVKELNEHYGVGIEYYLMDAFWFKEGQPYIDFKRKTFPCGVERTVKYIEDGGLKFGLWFDLSMIFARMKGMEKYSAELSNGALCFACDEVASLMKKALLYHIENHRVKMVKLDFMFFECRNHAHGHSADNVESKERSIKNFIAIVKEIKEKYPDVIFLCYNGWTTALDWIGSVEQRSGYAVSPYWAQYADYIYCGDPRPSEIATENFAHSICYYTDAMIRNFREAGMPFSAIDDDGAMFGDVHAIYWQRKEHLRLALLLGVVRGGYKLHLYGDLSILDDGDKKYIAYLSCVFDEAVEHCRTTEFLLGDARRGELYGYNRHCDTQGYAVVVNPTPLAVTQFVQICGEPLTGEVIVRDGEVTSEPTAFADGGFTLSLKPFGYVLVKWRVAAQSRRVQKIILSAGEALRLLVRGAKAISLTFTEDSKPLRTKHGLPEGIAVTVDGKRAEGTVRQNIWSGCSWVYVELNGGNEVKISNGGKNSFMVKYEFYV